MPMAQQESFTQKMVQLEKQKQSNHIPEKSGQESSAPGRSDQHRISSVNSSVSETPVILASRENMQVSPACKLVGDSHKLSGNSKDQTEKAVRDFVSEKPLSETPSHSQKSDCGESSQSPARPHSHYESSKHSSRSSCPKTHHSSSSHRHSESSVEKHRFSNGHGLQRSSHTSSSTHKYKEDASIARKKTEELQSGIPSTKGYPKVHKESGSDSSSPKSRDVHGSASKVNDKHQSESCRSRTDKHKNSSSSENKHPPIKHTSKTSEVISVANKHKNILDRLDSKETASSKCDNCSEFHLNNEFGHMKPATDKQKSVSVQGNSNDEQSSHTSPTSNEIGPEMDGRSYVTVPEVSCEKEENSEKHSSTDANKCHERDSTDAGVHASERHSFLKSSRRKRSQSGSTSDHKTHGLDGSSKHHIEIKPISCVVNDSTGYITSPDISSDEEEQKEVEKTAKHQSVTLEAGSLGPDELSRHLLKPSVDRQGGSYTQRLKILEKLQAVRQDMAEKETGYHRKRAARGEVKKRRARREKLEGDFSGPCRDKIEYNIEDKPSLRRPEPKPEPPPPEKPVKENKEKQKREKREKKRHRESTEKQSVRRHSTGESKPKSGDRRKEKKRRITHPSAVDHSEMPSSARSAVGPDLNSSSSSDAPAPKVSQTAFQAMKDKWALLFKSKSKGETSPAPPPLHPDSEMHTSPPDLKKRKMEDAEEGSKKRNDEADENTGQQ